MGRNQGYANNVAALDETRLPNSSFSVFMRVKINLV
jgi:hypothetical protein